MHRFVLLNIIVIAFTGLVFFLLLSYLHSESTTLHYTVCTNLNETGGNMWVDSFPYDELTAQYSVEENLHFDVEISKQWVDNPQRNIVGAQYDVTISNDTAVSLLNWTVMFQVPNNSRLDSSWSGDFSFDKGRITVTPLEYNLEIPAGEDITFGFILLTSLDGVHIPEGIITYTLDKKLQDNPLFLFLCFVIFALVIFDLSFLLAAFRVHKFRIQQKKDKAIIGQSLHTFANIIDAKDTYTSGHSIRVASYSREIARRMNLSEEDVERIYYTGLLHDIGKIGISDAILTKPGKLTANEREIIKHHVTIGGNILKDFNSIPGIAEGALYHHERYDGNGYVNGLKEKDIPLFARIICVADSYDAMNSARCYRKALTKEYIIQEIKDNAGKQFDPDIARIMLEMIHDGKAEEIERISKEDITLTGFGIGGLTIQN